MSLRKWKNSQLPVAMKYSTWCCFKERQLIETKYTYGGKETMGLIGVYKLAYDYDRKCSLIKERDIAYDANFCVKEA